MSTPRRDAGVPRTRRVLRQSGGEDTRARAMRLAEVQLAGWIAARAEAGERTSAAVANAYVAGAIAGYLAAADDWCEEPAKPARRGR